MRDSVSDRQLNQTQHFLFEMQREAIMTSIDPQCFFLPFFRMSVYS